MSSVHTIFCDETGNSGSRYFSPDQPVYAEGGWLVADDKRAELENTVIELEQRFRFTPKTKGTRLKDSPKGREYIAAVLAAVGQTATPFFYLVEKKYFICAKAVGTYFDPDYNSVVDPEELSDPRMRKLRADILYAAPDPILLNFAEAFRDQNAAGLVAVGKDWADALMASGQTGLATQLRFSLSDLQRNMQGEFERFNELGLSRGWDTLNAPSFAQAVQLIEQAAPPCVMLHDQCDSLQASLRFFFARYHDADHRIVQRRDGSIEVFGFRSLRALSFGDSESLPLLRAADYLLAGCVDFTRRALADEPIPEELRTTATFGLSRMMHEARGVEPPASVRFQIGELMASDRWIAKVSRAFV
jgi:hypothetical protein